MEKTTKSVLASIFIFPGIGHLLLKKYFRATALIGIAMVALMVVVVHVVTITKQVLERVMLGEVEPSYLEIRRLVAEQQASTGDQAVQIAVGVLVVTWLVGIVDAYRVGKIQEKSMDNRTHN